MASPQWSSYQELLDALWETASRWKDTTDAERLDEELREQVDGGPFASRLADLKAELASDCTVAEAVALIRFFALSRPAAAYGYGAGWNGYFLSELSDGTSVFSGEQYAEPQTWDPVEAAQDGTEAAGDESAEPAASSPAAPPALTFDDATGLLHDGTTWYLPDGRTTVTPDPEILDHFRDGAGTRYARGEPADLRRQHFMIAEGRWRRLTASGDAEYYDDAAGLWQRWHDTGAWLPYDAPSDTWLSGGRWVSADQVGRAAPDAAAAPAGTDRIGEVEKFRTDHLGAAIREIRAAGVSAEVLSDQQIGALLDQQVGALLGSSAG